MPSNVRSRFFALFSTVALIVGCSSSNGPPVSPVAPGGVTPTKSPTATPSGGASSTPTTAPSASGSGTPTAGPSASPTKTPTPTTAPSASPTATGIGPSLNCTAPVAPIPGNYLSLFSFGLTAGSPGSYAQDPAFPSQWSYDAYSLATPTPVPTVTPTLAPTPVPTATPTAVPTTTPTPTMYSLYIGTFTVTGFSGSSPAPYTVAPQTGCMFVELNQPVGGTIAQNRSRPNVASTPNPNDNTIADGFPNVNNAADYNESNIATGFVTQFNITNLSESKGTGSGTFTLDSGATGTVTIQSATNQVFALPNWVRRALAREQRMHARASAQRR